MHDDASARRNLRSLLAQQAGIEIVAECDSAYVALRILAVQGAELLFLKASLPGADELQRLGRSSLDRAPAIVLLPPRSSIRSDDRRAKGEELGTLDRDGLRAILRAALPSAQGVGASDAAEPLSPPSRPSRQRLKIEHDRRSILLEVAQILWIDALGNYVKIHCGDRSYTLRETMKNLQARLDPERFVRIHRSTILNVDKVEEIQRRPGGGFLAILPGGQRLAVSRRRKGCLDRLLR